MTRHAVQCEEKNKERESNVLCCVVLYVKYYEVDVLLQLEVVDNVMMISVVACGINRHGEVERGQGDNEYNKGVYNVAYRSE